MNINIIEISKAVEKGLGIGEFIYLKMIDDGCLYLINSEKLKPYYNGLFMGGYVFEDKITEKGKEFLKSVEENDKVSKKVDNSFKDIYVRLGEFLKSKIGKKQILGFGNKYFMFSSALELENTLKRFWKFYPEYNDIVKIEKCLVNHIEKCAKTNKFAPAVQYFIIKEQDKGKPISQLLAAYDELDEVELEKEIKIEPKEIKNLF